MVEIATRRYFDSHRFRQRCSRSCWQSAPYRPEFLPNCHISLWTSHRLLATKWQPQLLRDPVDLARDVRGSGRLSHKVLVTLRRDAACGWPLKCRER